MKKYIAILGSIIIACTSSYSVSYGASPIKIEINNIPMNIEVAPEIVNGRTMVPFRSIFEGLGAKVEWNETTREGKGILQNGKWVSFSNGRRFANSNKGSIEIDSPAIIRNGRLLIPVKAASEALGADISWNQSKRLVSIVTPNNQTAPAFKSLNPRETTQTPALSPEKTLVSSTGKTVFIGQSKSDLISLLGSPNRIDTSEKGYELYIYNSDYSKYIQLGVHNGNVVEIYTNAKDWMGDSSKIGVKLSDDSKSFNRAYTQTVINGFERQVFDLTNSYRVSNGLKPFEYCETASTASRLHSLDMANLKYFSHTSLSGTEPWDRMALQGIRYSSAGENLAMGQQNAADVVEAWINSSGHRKNLLGDFKALGVGIYSQGNASGTYYTQNFYTAR